MQWDVHIPLFTRPLFGDEKSKPFVMTPAKRHVQIGNVLQNLRVITEQPVKGLYLQITELLCEHGAVMLEGSGKIEIGRTSTDTLALAAGCSVSIGETSTSTHIHVRRCPQLHVADDLDETGPPSILIEPGRFATKFSHKSMRTAIPPHKQNGKPLPIAALGLPVKRPKRPHEHLSPQEIAKAYRKLMHDKCPYCNALKKQIATL